MFEFAIIAAAAADATGEAAGLPQLDPKWWPSQLFWLTVTFAFLYFLMAGRFLPAIGGAIEERRDRIADDLDQAAEFKREAEEAEAAYRKSLSDAKAKAQSIAADTRAEVDADIQRMQAESDDKLEEELQRAEERIADMKREASEKVDEAARDTARALVEALIDEAPTQDAVADAVARAKH